MKKFTNSIILFFKGIIMGLANIIPGVSGGTLAIILGVYEKLINAISTLFKKFKENLLFIIPIVIGMGVAIVVSSGLIEYCLNNYPLATVLFFVGLILGGIPLLFKKINKHLKSVSNISIFVIIAALLLCYTFLSSEANDVNLTSLNLFGYIKLFVVGIIAAATMIVPGISGSMTLMTLGYYNGILNTISNIFDFSLLGQNLQVCIPFGLGVVVGFFAVAKLIGYLLSKFEVKTYFGIFGFIFASLIIIFRVVDKIEIIELLVGLVLLALGFILSYFIANFKKEEVEEEIKNQEDTLYVSEENTTINGLENKLENSEKI